MKRFWTKRFETAVVIVIGLALLMYYVKPNYNGKCHEFIEIVNSQHKRNELIQFAKKIASVGEKGLSDELNQGVLRLNELKDPGLYEANLLPLHEAHVGLGLYGKNINYNDLSKSKIESVLIGYGGRVFIMIDVNESGKFDFGIPIFKEKEVKAKVDNFIVVCRNNNFDN